MERLKELGGKVAMLMIAFRGAQQGGSVATGANGGQCLEDWKQGPANFL